MLLFATACEDTNCSQCGFEAGEHIVTTYVNADNQTVYVSGYADDNGCFTAVNCP